MLNFFHIQEYSIFKVFAQDGGVLLFSRQEVDQRSEVYFFFTFLKHCGSGLL